MEVRLPAELERFVEERVRAGQFASASEVIEGAIQLLKDQEQLTREDIDELRREIAVGVQQLDEGQGRPWDAEEMKRRVAAHMKKAV